MGMAPTTQESKRLKALARKYADAWAELARPKLAAEHRSCSARYNKARQRLYQAIDAITQEGANLRKLKAVVDTHASWVYAQLDK